MVKEALDGSAELRMRPRTITLPVDDREHRDAKVIRERTLRKTQLRAAVSDVGSKGALLIGKLSWYQAFTLNKDE